MLNLTIKDEGVKKLLESLPKTAHRAAELALDQTARDIKEAEYDEMRRVFDNPVPYTLKSLQMTPTMNHVLQASVWFKDPDRMTQHYLVPQVEGGVRKLKGFERALGRGEYIPGKGARMTKYGNVSPGQIRQFLSVLGKAERTAGYSANISKRSKRRNRKQRDFVLLPDGSSRGALPPGIYQRVKTARGFGAKKRRNLPFGEWQKGKRSEAVRARGLRPIMVEGKEAPVTPRLDFYGIAGHVFDGRFSSLFYSFLNNLLK